jgi:hypothetical protein
MFFVGMGLVTLPLFLLSLTSWQARLARHSRFDGGVRAPDIEPASPGAGIA